MSDIDVGPCSGNDETITDGPAREGFCNATKFRVSVNKILLTGAVKAKYEVQGELSLVSYRPIKVARLQRIRGESYSIKTHRNILILHKGYITLASTNPALVLYLLHTILLMCCNIVWLFVNIW